MKRLIFRLWLIHCRLAHLAVGASLLSIVVMSVLVAWVSPLMNNKQIQEQFKTWWLITGVTTATTALYCSLTEKCDRYFTRKFAVSETVPLSSLILDADDRRFDADPHEWERMEADESHDEILEIDPLLTSILNQCQDCQNYHGQTYNGILFICAIHPYGQEDCPDLETESDEVVERNSEF